MFKKSDEETENTQGNRLPKKMRERWSLSLNVLRRFLSKSELTELIATYNKNKKNSRTRNVDAWFKTIEEPDTTVELACLDAFLFKTEELGKSFVEFEKEIGVPRGTGKNRATNAAFKIMYAVKKAGSLEQIMRDYDVELE